MAKKKKKARKSLSRRTLVNVKRLRRMIERDYSRLHESGLASLVNEEMVLEEHDVRGHHVYVLGEVHYSRAPYDYFRAHIEPRLAREKGDWLFLIEDFAGCGSGQRKLTPFHTYLAKLAGMNSIPIEEALLDHRTKEVRDYISLQEGFPGEVIDAMLIDSCIATSPEVFGQDLTEQVKIRLLARYLELPRERIEAALPFTPCPFFFQNHFAPHWNHLCQDRFYTILDKYPDQKNVLVNAGHGHNPAFQ